MSPNSKTILGSGSGSNIEYKIIAKYGSPLTLDATPYGTDRFLGWYKNGAKISDIYEGFNDGETIEARFGSIVTLNIIHIGNGVNYGETSISQNMEVVGESNGRNSYTVNVEDGSPIKLEHSIIGDIVEFNGWQDSDGNLIDINSLELYDGLTIYAEFSIKKANITVIHKGAPIISNTSQNGMVLGGDTGQNTNYTIRPSMDSEIYITHSSSDSTYDFVRIVDELGVEYSGVVPANKIRSGMRITIEYKLGFIGVTIKHVGTSGGFTSASQDGVVLGSGNGGQEVQYTVNINKDKSLSLYGRAQDQQGDMKSKFLGFEHPNGNPVGVNDTFNDGDIIYAVFDIEIDHDFDWMFKVYWDERSETDIDSYTKLVGGNLDGQFVSYRDKKVALNDSDYAELDIDNTGHPSHNGKPEVTTILGKPCDKIFFRIEVYSEGDNFDAMNDLKIEVYKKGIRFNEHVKDYFVSPSVINVRKMAYEVCEVNLLTDSLRDIQRVMGQYNVRE